MMKTPPPPPPHTHTNQKKKSKFVPLRVAPISEAIIYFMSILYGEKKYYVSISFLQIMIFLRILRACVKCVMAATPMESAL